MIEALIIVGLTSAGVFLFGKPKTQAAASSAPGAPAAAVPMPTQPVQGTAQRPPAIAPVSGVRIAPPSLKNEGTIIGNHMVVAKPTSVTASSTQAKPASVTPIIPVGRSTSHLAASHISLGRFSE